LTPACSNWTPLRGSPVSWYPPGYRPDIYLLIFRWKLAV